MVQHVHLPVLVGDVLFRGIGLTIVFVVTGWSAQVSAQKLHRGPHARTRPTDEQRLARGLSLPKALALLHQPQPLIHVIERCNDEFHFNVVVLAFELDLKQFTRFQRVHELRLERNIAWLKS